MNDETKKIMSDMIDDPASPMRTDIDRDALYELATSIKQHGLINPITVRPVGERFEVVAGHRRFSACKIAGVISISCVVRDLDDSATFAVRAVENLFREDIDPVDEALFIAEYMEKENLEEKQIAQKINRSLGYVQDRLAILKMPDYLIEHLKHRKIKLGHALALMKIDDDTTRHVWVELAVRDGVSVKQVEWWVHNYEIDKIRMTEATDPAAAAGDIPAGLATLQQCVRCGAMDKMSEMSLVWVHSGDCPPSEPLP